MGMAGKRIACWSAWLLCFNYDIVSRPGAADCLSRLPLPYDQDCSPDMETETVAAVPTLQLAVPISDFTDVCFSCPELRKPLMGGLHPPIDCMPYYQVRYEL